MQHFNPIVFTPKSKNIWKNYSGVRKEKSESTRKNASILHSFKIIILLYLFVFFFQYKLH